MVKMQTRISSSMFDHHLEYLKEKGLYRRLRAIDGEQGSWVNLEGKRVLNLCSNDYLGIASHLKLKEAATLASYKYGCGSGASRLVCGNMTLHETLERRIASFKKTEAALVYTSGYAANIGIISSVVRKGDFVFSDELNHASIIDGCRLSRAEIKVFPHNDIAALEEKLSSILDTHPEGQCLIVVDGVFSMDGDLAPLQELVDLAERCNALLMVDEAHATGALGPGGRGAVAHFGLEGRVPIMMGTLGKALGSFGGFVAGSQELIEYLVNTSRSFIFTTALPPPVIASALAALDILEERPSLVVKLHDNARYLRKGLRDLGYHIITSQTQILPVIIGESDLACEISRLLLKEGILATAIRPPTVPEGTSRIRLTVTAAHTIEDLDFALSAFDRVGRNVKII